MFLTTKEARSIEKFIEERCLLGDGYTVTNKDLYDSYAAWCIAHCFQRSSKQALNTVLTEKYNCERFRREAYRGMQGIALKE